MNREQFQNACAKIVARAWADEEFKQRLLSDPRSVLDEHGIDVPKGIEFKVVESTSTSVYLVIPPRPGPLEVELTDLEERHATYGTYCHSSGGGTF